MISHQLRDGTAVAVRPVQAHDAHLFAVNFARYSDEARASRFGMAKPRLSSAELRYLTAIDHVNHEALLAIDPATGDGIAVGRYVRLPDDPQSAELAIIVRDDWQRRGAGRLLGDLLEESARAAGIRRWTANALASNRPALELAFRLGFRIASRSGPWIELERSLAAASAADGRPAGYAAA